MTSTSMDDIPVELHTCILTYLLSYSLQPAPLPERYSRLKAFQHLFPATLDWSEHDSRSKSLFPFNVASVCKLWYDILSKIPECWTRVVFDVASDPTLFLDAFVWSDDLENIEVVVFNSLDGTGELGKALEARRVSAIAHALQPHVRRCKSILFEVRYSSSLPPPTIVFFHDAPKLEELILRCCVDDIVVTTHSSPGPLTTEEKEPSFTTSFPQLIKLSITGFWFMNMALQAHNTDWLEELKCGNFMELEISHFNFPMNGPYALRKFAVLISKMRVCATISFRGLSLTNPDEHSDPPDNPNLVNEISADLHFLSVSKGFISCLYSFANLRPQNSLSFEDCEIPNIMHPQDVYYLTLLNICDGNSLRNILAVWGGSNLTIRSCPSFTDTIISWLGSKGIETNLHSSTLPPAPLLHYLTIEHCDDFTPLALRNAIHVRAEIAHRWMDVGSPRPNTLRSLNVARRVPDLTQEGKVWFANSRIVRTTWWRVQNDGSLQVEFPVS